MVPGTASDSKLIGNLSDQVLAKYYLRLTGCRIRLGTITVQPLVTNEDGFPADLTSYGSFFLTANEGIVPSF